MPVVRSSMSDLIARTRELVGDPDTTGRTLYFSDIQVQQALDWSRTDIQLSQFHELLGTYSISGGQQLWTDYFDAHGYGDWETDVQLYNGSFTLLTPTTSDYLVGHWTFAVSQPPPVYLVGKQYDLYLAGSQLCYKRAAVQTESFDVSLHRQQMMRSQKFINWFQLAASLASQARPRSAQLVRRDMHGPYAW
jgi:hypothetical protein